MAEIKNATLNIFNQEDLVEINIGCNIFWTQMELFLKTEYILEIHLNVNTLTDNSLTKEFLGNFNYLPNLISPSEKNPYHFLRKFNLAPNELKKNKLSHFTTLYAYLKIYPKIDESTAITNTVKLEL